MEPAILARKLSVGHLAAKRTPVEPPSPMRDRHASSNLQGPVSGPVPFLILFPACLNGRWISLSQSDVTSRGRRGVSRIDARANGASVGSG